MIAIIILVFFGVLLLFAGVLNMHKSAMPIGVLGLAFALIFCFQDIDTLFIGYKNMFLFTEYARAFSALLIFSTILVFLLGSYFLSEDNNYKADKFALMLFSLSGAITMVSSQNLLMIQRI